MRLLIVGDLTWPATPETEVARVWSADAVAAAEADAVAVGPALLDAVVVAAVDRPVVVVGDPAEEAAWLSRGAAEVVPPDADAEAAARALRRAVARAACADRSVAFERRYRALLGALPDVIARLRDDGFALDFYVPGGFETEFPAAQMVGRRLADAIPSELAARFDAAVAELRASGRAAPYRYRVDVGGEARWREVRIVANGPDEVLSLLRDVTDLERSARALQRSRAELRGLAARLQAVREEERSRLSRDVHDVIGQGLTAIRLVAGGILRRHPDDPEVQSRVTDLRALVDETIGTVRRLSTDLRPGVLDDLGLVAALEWQARRFEERSGLTCVVESTPDEGLAPGRLPEPVGTAVFRIVQEALTNVARHAEASEVTVRVLADGADLALEVQDDGRGLAPPEPDRTPLGLVGMRERALAVGGELSVAAPAAGGVLVRGTFPAVLRPRP